MTIPSLLFAVAAGVAATACAAGAGGAGAPTPPGPPAHMGLATVEAAVQAARADAARRKGVAAEAVAVVSSEQVVWADGSIGCPRPDVMYTMALVPGYRVRLRVQGELLDYHASRRGALVLCPAGQSVEPAPGGATM